MKKFLFLPAVMTLMWLVLNAQQGSSGQEKVGRIPTKMASLITKEKPEPLKKLEGTTVSPVAKKDFYQNNGIIPAIWKRTPYYDQVSFNSGGENKTAYYDANAKLVGTIIQKKFEDLPEEARKYIDQKYPGYAKEAIAFFADNEFNTTDIVVFNKQFDDEDCFYAKLKKDNDEIILKIKMSGEVSFFKAVT